jgi:hypothetical protein
LFVCCQALCNNYFHMYTLCFLISSSRLLSPFAFSIQQAFNQTKSIMQVFSSSSSSSSLCSCNSFNTWAYLFFCRIGSFSILLSLPCLSKLINWLEFSCAVSQLPTNCDNTMYLGSFDTTYIFLSNTKIGILGKSIYIRLNTLKVFEKIFFLLSWTSMKEVDIIGIEPRYLYWRLSKPSQCQVHKL